MVLKLNLGSGGRKRPGYFSVDMNNIENDKIDIAHDLNEPLPFKDNSVDEIYASHIIEHFWYNETNNRLCDWFRVLKKGGHIDIWTFDLDIVAENIKKDMNWVNWRLYAGANYKGSAHHACFNERWLKECMQKVGFKKLRKIPNKEYPFPRVHTDMNLGVRGYK